MLSLMNERFATDPVPAETDVVILGGGPAGLAAAWELTANGARVLVVEKEGATGGLCRTFRDRGFSFDQGGHRFITRDRDLFERVVSLLRSRLHVAERHSVIRLGEREYTYPLSLSEVLRGEGPLAIARVLSSWLAARIRPSTGPAGSFEAWARRRFGGELYDRFFGGYTEKLWGIPAAELSDDWAGERIPRLSLGAIAKRFLRLERRPPRTFARRYSYPRHGIGEIFEAVAVEVERRGGRILTGSTPTALRGGRRAEVEVETPLGELSIAAERVISTIPLPELSRLLFPEGSAAEARSLRHRGLRFLNLELGGPPIAERTWIYVPDSRCAMTRVQIPIQRSIENCPPGKSSVQLEIPCDPGDALWECPHEELLDRGLRDLSLLGFDARGSLEGSFDTRARHAYPVYGRGYRERRDALLARIDALPWIDTRGRQGRFSYIFFDRAMREGIEAARDFLGLAPGVAPSARDPLLPEEAGSVVEELPTGPITTGTRGGRRSPPRCRARR